MKCVFRLAEVIHQHAPQKPKHGLFSEIAQWSELTAKAPEERLSRRYVADLYHKKDRSFSLRQLDCLCRYLIEKCNVPPSSLPHELFGAKDRRLIEFIGATQQIQFFLGMRYSTKEWGPNAYVMASDARLQGKLTSMYSKFNIEHPQVDPPAAPLTILLDAPRRSRKGANTKLNGAQRNAKKKFVEFQKTAGRMTGVASGSMKVNCVSELIIANVFGIKPYVEDRPSKAVNRRVPFFVRYRATDPQPKSCFGGTVLSDDCDSKQPGIYYEASDNEWKHVPCDDVRQDTAFLACHQENDSHVLLACGGFSSRATHYFSEELENIVEDLWPPQRDRPRQKVGIFVIRFKHKKGQADPKGSFPDLVEKPEVIRLDDSVVERRLS